MRKALITIASLAVAVGSLGLAPAALASNETAQFSSLSSGAQPSGVITFTMTTGGNSFRVSFPRSYFTGPDLSSVADCTSIGGITVEVNGTAKSIATCTAALGNSYALTLTFPSPMLSVADQVTLTWQSGWLTNTSSLTGASVTIFQGPFVANQVTPTLLPSPPAGAVTPIPMWQQAIGRASATASCPDGYTGSWDTWPNGGTGGYVCNRFVPVYGN